MVCFVCCFFVVFFATDAVAFLNSHFGASTGPRTVYLDEVQCTGRETNLTDCPHSSTISCSSVHSYAGVRCQGLENIVAFDLLEIAIVKGNMLNILL